MELWRYLHGFPEQAGQYLQPKEGIDLDGDSFCSTYAVGKANADIEALVQELYADRNLSGQHFELAIDDDLQNL